MQIKNYFVLTALIAGVFLLSACRSSEAVKSPLPPTISPVDQIVQKHLAARGGVKMISSIKSLKWVGEVHMMGMNMPITLYISRPGKVRTEIEVPSMNMEVISAYDGETAWMLNPMAGNDPVKLPADQAANIADQADLDGPLYNYRAKGFEVTLIGEEEVGGAMASKLKLTRPDHPDRFLFIDNVTDLIVKSEGQGTNPQTGQPVSMATMMSDFRDVGGVKMPFGLNIEMNGQPFQEIVMKDAKVNPPLSDKLFAYPGI